MTKRPSSLIAIVEEAAATATTSLAHLKLRTFAGGRFYQQPTTLTLSPAQVHLRFDLRFLSLSLPLPLSRLRSRPRLCVRLHTTFTFAKLSTPNFDFTYKEDAMSRRETNKNLQISAHIHLDKVKLVYGFIPPSAAQSVDASCAVLPRETEWNLWLYLCCWRRI